jgi:hypothetical protein
MAATRYRRTRKTSSVRASRRRDGDEGLYTGTGLGSDDEAFRVARELRTMMLQSATLAAALGSDGLGPAAGVGSAHVVALREQAVKIQRSREHVDPTIRRARPLVLRSIPVPIRHHFHPGRAGRVFAHAVIALRRLRAKRPAMRRRNASASAARVG